MAVPQLDPAKLQLVQELEIEMMSDMYNRLVTACHRKCIPVKYHEPELGEYKRIGAIDNTKITVEWAG